MSISRTPGEFAERDSQLARLAAAARRWRRLNQLFKQQLPPALCHRCRAVRINEDGVMVVFADSGTVAARLKLLAPSLLPVLDAAGFSAQRIQVRVVLRTIPPERENRLRLSRRALDALNDGADQVSDPDLAESLRRLARHHGE